MANVEKYQVNGVSLAPPPYMGKGQSDTASPKSGRFHAVELKQGVKTNASHATIQRFLKVYKPYTVKTSDQDAV